MLRTTLSIACCLPVSLALAGPWQSPHSLQKAAQDYIAQHPSVQNRAKVQVVAGAIDPRLRLTKCAQPLTAQLPPGYKPSGTVSVGISCTQPSFWSIYVPVTIRLLERVAVLNRPLSAGDTITADDVGYLEKDVSRLGGGYLIESDTPVGKKVKFALRAGTLLNRQHLRIPMYVRRGQGVVIMAKAGKLTVRMSGTALADGSEGDAIRVENKSSSRIIDAIVKSPGIVQVTM